MNKILALSLLFILSSCYESDQFDKSEWLHHNNPPPLGQRDDRVPLSTLNIEGAIDILWVIDNSGSMQTIQNNVIANSKIFMEQFVRQKYIKWKMGLISTDKRDRPRLGFDSVFDDSLIDHSDPTSFDTVVNQFQTAVSGLGTNGDASEYTFYNILRLIQEYDSRVPFIRNNSHLAVIMVTDEVEQSEDFGAQYQALTFLNSLRAFVNPSRKTRFYGAFDFKDLTDCNSSWGDEYQNSAFEQIIDETGGFHISACVPDFGSKLVEVGKDIASLAGKPSLVLKDQPKVETIKLYYNGKLLPPGKPENGGYWFYDNVVNTINFYSLEFVDDLENASFKVYYDIDDGIDDRP